MSWQGRDSSRPRQSTSRRAGEAGAAGGGVCMPVRELSVWGRVCWRGVALARLRSSGERAGGVGARRGLCESMRERGGGPVADGGFRVLCCGGPVGFYVAGWGQVRRGIPRRPKERTRHRDLGRRRQVSAEWVSWQGRGRSRPRQSTSRRAGEAGAAGGGVCVPVRELSVRGRVCWFSVALAPAQQRGEGRWCWREAGVV